MASGLTLLSCVPRAGAQNTFPKSLVCGVVPLFKGEEWMLVSGWLVAHKSSSTIALRPMAHFYFNV